MRSTQRAGAVLAAVAMLAGCSKASPSGEIAQEGVAEPPSAAAPPAKKEGVKVSLPQIAYTYRYAFELPADEIPAAIREHIAACDRMGPTRCHIIEMQSETSDGQTASGTLKLIVEAGGARAFGAALGKLVSEKGGRQSDSGIEAEDLSKQIVDTEAHLRAKQALAERLMGLLRTRSGPVADLVAAERSVAEVQEEIDAAQSWLAEARGRVAMSTFEISYRPGGGAGSLLLELQSSFREMGVFLGRSLSMLITLVVVLLPWLLLGGTVALGVRWLRRRFWRSDDE